MVFIKGSEGVVCCLYNLYVVKIVNNEILDCVLLFVKFSRGFHLLSPFLLLASPLS